MSWVPERAALSRCNGMFRDACYHVIFRANGCSDSTYRLVDVSAQLSFQTLACFPQVIHIGIGKPRSSCCAHSLLGGLERDTGYKFTC